MDSFTTEAFTLLGIGLGVIGLRTGLRYNQVGGLRGFQADDYLMLVAAMVYSCETFLAYSVGAYWLGLANNSMTDEERANLDPNSHEFYLRVNGSKTQVAGWSSYTLLLWILKACMCTFYLRLTADLAGFQRKIQLGFVLIVATWLAVLLGILFGCGLPFSKNWQISPNPGNACQPAVSRIDILMTVVLNVTTDMYLLSIPVPLLWKARLPVLKKVAVGFCFSGGLFVTTAAILRCVLILTDTVNGAQLAGSWAVRETFVAVVTTNLPMLSKLIQAGINGITSDKFRSWFSRPSKYGRSDGTQLGESGQVSIQLKDKAQSGKVVRSLYHITAVTESEERIMGGGATTNQSDQQVIRDEESAVDVLSITKQLEVVVTSSSGPKELASEVERVQTLGYMVQERGVVGPSAECSSSS